MTGKGVTEYVRTLYEYHRIKGSMSIEKFAEMVGVSVDELCYIFTWIIIHEGRETARIKDEYYKLRKEKLCIEKALNDVCKNKTEMQQRKVKSGFPIAKKSSRISEMKLYMLLGDTDEDIMRKLKISKTTLWRYKKELEERERNGKI